VAIAVNLWPRDGLYVEIREKESAGSEAAKLEISWFVECITVYTRHEVGGKINLTQE
jgi:hypothetical protein